MKLNYKRTILVGFAFFLICAFWQAYDNTIPLILTNKFGMSQTWSGAIMALDNVLALFMLPLFGHLSDKCTHPRGRRTPFIVVGTLIAAVALIALSFVDNAQLKHLDKVSAIDDPAALEEIYQSQKEATLLTPGGEEFILGQRFTKEEFTAIRSQISTRSESEGDKTVTNPDYTNYVVPARQACAHTITRTEDLLSELRTIRRQGYAVDAEEYCLGLYCIAMPIRDYTEKIIAAVSVSTPTVRMNDEKKRLILDALGKCAHDISRALGYPR